MIDVDPRPEKSTQLSPHIGIVALTTMGALFAVVAFVSGYVTGLLTMRDTLSSLRADFNATVTSQNDIRNRMTHIEDMIQSIDERTLRDRTKQ